MFNTLRDARQIVRESPYADAAQSPRKRKVQVSVTRTSLGRVNSPLQAVVPTQYRERYGTGY